ncbi:sporulation protein YjcZ [Chengkuizengella sediminis]|uniref:sporulation protein YjcZ n=1 Tax=Chengkuizengella sediminis TaxID=1885917 RepID=UPI00138A0D04|nr:sporulation protein YjcZ [Chengkuizengella sediminis]NDI34547.1 sporulation protein YjcZ [Chengkuizengella sediminis]
MSSHSSGAAIVLVLFILLVIILVAASGGSRYCSCGSSSWDSVEDRERERFRVVGRFVGFE